MISIDYYQASTQGASYSDSFIVVCTSKMVFDHEYNGAYGYKDFKADGVTMIDGGMQAVMILVVERVGTADPTYANLEISAKYKMTNEATVADRKPKILNDIKVFTDLAGTRAIGMTWHGRRVTYKARSSSSMIHTDHTQQIAAFEIFFGEGASVQCDGTTGMAVSTDTVTIGQGHEAKMLG
jgi:hypothetical protein